MFYTFFKLAKFCTYIAIFCKECFKNSEISGIITKISTSFHRVFSLNNKNNESVTTFYADNLIFKMTDVSIKLKKNRS